MDSSQPPVATLVARGPSAAKLNRGKGTGWTGAGALAAGVPGLILTPQQSRRRNRAGLHPEFPLMSLRLTVSFAALALAASVAPALADEGMWTFDNFPIET